MINKETLISYLENIIVSQVDPLKDHIEAIQELLLTFEGNDISEITPTINQHYSTLLSLLNTLNIAIKEIKTQE